MSVHYTREIKSGVKNLMQHKLRSFLTMLGMVFGVGSVIAMLAVGEGASAEALEQIRKLGSNNIMINSIKPVEDENSSSSGSSRLIMYGLTYLDFDRIRAGFPDVRTVVPVKRVRQEGQLGARTLQLRVVGTTSAWFNLVNRERLAGRVLKDLDNERHKQVVVLTEHGARRLLATEQSVGSKLRLGGVVYEVIGIVRSEGGEISGGGVQTPDDPTDAYIPLSVARDRYGDIAIERSAGSRSMEMVELHQVIVQVNETDNVPSVSQAIGFMLNRFHARKDYEIAVPLALLQQREATKRTFNIVLGSIAGISLLVGGIGIMNIMLASVTERTREIGIRRAIGAKRRQIVSQFLIETVVLSMTGGVLGIAIGLAIPWMITRLAGMPTVVDPTSLTMALMISMTIGIVFGLYPAVRAAQLDPIEALRHE